MELSDFTGLIGLTAHVGMMQFVLRATNPAEIGAGTEDVNDVNFGPNFKWDHFFDAADKLNANAVVIPAKHCDGVTNWPSTAAAGHTIYDSTGWTQPVERDLVQEFCDMAVARGKWKGFLFEVGDNWLKLESGGGFAQGFVPTTLLELTEICEYEPDFIVLDAWGSFWSSSGFPGFDDIPLATLVDHIHTLLPNCIVMVNNHDALSVSPSGDIPLYEETVDGEPKSGYHPYAVCWRPMHRQNGLFQWFPHSDDLYEELQPAVSLAALSQQKMLERRYAIFHNVPLDHDGRFKPDFEAIIDALADTTVPRFWRGLDACFRFEEATAASAAVEEIHRVQTNVSLLAVNNPTVAAGVIGSSRVMNGTTQALSRECDQLSLYSLGNRRVSILFRLKFVTIIGNYDTPFAKDYNGNSPLIEWEMYLDTGNGNRPVLRLGNGTGYQDIEATNFGSVTANQWITGVLTYDPLNKLASIQINGGTPNVETFNGPLPASISPFTFGAIGGTSGKLRWAHVQFDAFYIFTDRIFTEADGVAFHNSAVGFDPFAADGSFNLLPSSPIANPIFRIKGVNSDGTGATGILYSDFTIALESQYGVRQQLTVEPISVLGTYEAPTSPAHIRLGELSSDPPTEGIYQIQLHNHQLYNNGNKLWLYFTSTNPDVKWQPLEIDLTNKVTHVGDAKQTDRDLGAGVVARLGTVLGNVSAAQRLLTAASQASVDDVRAGISATNSVSPFIVDDDHIWSFDSRTQMTSPDILVESIGEETIFKAVDFSEPLTEDGSILSIDLVSIANVVGATKPIITEAKISSEKKKVNLTLNATEATAATYTITVSITSVDLRTFTRYMKLTLQ